MRSSDNKAIIACAGSGKTTRLVLDAINDRNRRIAIVTYTNFNAREIARKFAERNSGIPRHVDLMTWYGFLLNECARPYQCSKYADRRIESICFVNQRSAVYAKEADTRKFYFANDELIYSDKIARFVVECEMISHKSVSTRLRQIYTDVFLDEFQDLAGWDLDVIGMLLQSGIRVTLVGDPRQHIYSTNPGPKHSQYQGIKVIDLLRTWERNGLCSLEYMNTSYRCNSSICEFSNALWPGMDAMTSTRSDVNEHSGVYLVAQRWVDQYVQRFKPQVLRHDKRAQTYGYPALNFGLSKGLEFERVLIVPTEPIKRYLQSASVSNVKNCKDRLHVAVTRARHSVAFVFDGDSPVVSRHWEP